MQYLILIYSDPATGPQTEAEMAESMPAWFAYGEEMAAAGVLVAGEALQPTQTATTIRSRDGDVSHTDGPFAETKEILGGFYMINVDNLDDALAWGAKCPAVTYGSIEVRPVISFEQ